MRYLFRVMICLGAAVLLSACASKPMTKLDYTAYKQSNPRSILVLPPLNNSPDVSAGYSVLSQLSYPLAESGYYVLPVALVDATFKQNGLTMAADIHQVAPAKLREIFGADAALYVTISKYGSSYTVLDSVTVVTASARLVDLRSGTQLWSGSATASSAENQNNNGGGLVGMLITAAIKQVAHSLSDSGHDVAAVTSRRLLTAGHPNGLLFGPYSPRYGTD